MHRIIDPVGGGTEFFLFSSAGNFLNRQKEYNIRRAIGSSCRQVLGLLFAETVIMLMAVGIIVACLLELLYDRVWILV